MLRKRIIFTLIYSEGQFMQSRNFRLQKVGSLQWLNKNYKFQNISFAIDELILLNASRGNKNLIEFAETLSNIVNEVFIPISAGGGIKTLEDAELLFKSGADKIVINSLLIQDPTIIKELVNNYGSQSVVASIDCKLISGTHEIFIKDGTLPIERSLEDYIKYLEELGIGEIYLNSIDKDGTGFGYDKVLIESVKNLTTLPLIIAGGAGNESHLADFLKIDHVSAVATANLFNFIGDGLPKARKNLLTKGFNLAKW
jgi:cyclase